MGARKWVLLAMCTVYERSCLAEGDLPRRPRPRGGGHRRPRAGDADRPTTGDAGIFVVRITGWQEQTG